MKNFRESKDVQTSKPTSLNELSSFGVQIRQTLVGSTMLTREEKCSSHVCHRAAT
jgi:hypothetical protein